MARNTQGKNSKATSDNRSQSKARQSSNNGFLAAVRQRPLASAALAAGAAGAGAFLWARRGQIGELTETVAEKFASDDKQDAGRVSSSGFQSDDVGTRATAGTSKAPAVDPLVDEQLETGAIAYGA